MINAFTNVENDYLFYYENREGFKEEDRALNRIQKSFRSYTIAFTNTQYDAAACNAGQGTSYSRGLIVPTTASLRLVEVYFAHSLIGSGSG